MIKRCKICGVSDLKTLNFILDHPYPASFIGFICNYKKSHRFVEINKLKKLISVNKKNCKFVAVLVKPDKEILENIKNLDFDYYQLYDCSPNDIQLIKNKYGKKIITAFTVKNVNDIKKYELYNDVTDIYLFDSKGYEKSMSFDHNLIKNLRTDIDIMLAGNIQIDDELDNYKEITDIIDISGGLETSGLKDISKINIFLNKIKLINNET